MANTSPETKTSGRKRKLVDIRTMLPSTRPPPNNFLTTRKRSLGHGLYQCSYGNGIYAVAFSPDGKCVATGHTNGWVRLWNSPSLLSIAAIRAHFKPLLKMAFSSDGQLLATTGKDEMIRIWDMRDYRRIKTIKLGQKQVSSLVFSLDNKTILCCSDNYFLSWHISTGKCFQEYVDDNVRIMRVISPDARYLAAEFGKGEVCIEDINNDTKIVEIEENYASVLIMAFSPDSRYFVVRYDNKISKLYRVDTGNLVLTWKTSILYPHFAVSRQLIVFQESSEAIAIYSILHRRRLGVIPWSGLSYLGAVSISPDNRYVACGGVNHFGVPNIYDLYLYFPILQLDHLISSGLASSISTTWTQFLTQGLYDPRLFAFLIRPFLENEYTRS